MLGARPCARCIRRWIDVFDEPFADQAALPTMLLAGYARRDVTVVLTGEGADEVFGGYDELSQARARGAVCALAGIGRVAAPCAGPALPKRARKDRLLRSIAEPLQATISHHSECLRHADAVVAAVACAAGSDRGIARRRRIRGAGVRRLQSMQYLDRLLHVDTRLWLPDDLLTKVDRATMTHSLEARVPYLDHRLVEFCARLDARSEDSRHDAQVPAEAARRRVTCRRKSSHRGKQGFVMPLSEWLTGRLAGQVEIAPVGGGLACRGLFREGALERLVAEHRSGRRRHAGRLWALLILERWFRRYAPQWRMAHEARIVHTESSTGWGGQELRILHRDGRHGPARPSPASRRAARRADRRRRAGARLAGRDAAHRAEAAAAAWPRCGAGSRGMAPGST